jgi:hypothetical protein
MFQGGDGREKFRSFKNKFRHLFAKPGFVFEFSEQKQL